MRTSTRAGSDRRSPTSTSDGWQRPRSMRSSSAGAQRPTFSASASRPSTASATSTDRAATRFRTCSSGSIARSAALLEHLDASVGAGNYVLGLSADHGVSEIPEQIGGGRVVEQGRRDGAAEGARARARSRARTCCRRPTRTSTWTEPARKLAGEGQGACAKRLAALRSVEGIGSRLLGTRSRDEGRA